jgi:outer membrane protein
MKRSFAITKLSLGLLVAASIAACNQKPVATTASNTPATTTAASNTPASGGVVFINSDSLSSKYAYVKDIDKRLNDKGTAAKSDVQSKRDALQREYAEYQKNAQTMPADQRQATEQRLQREGQQEQAYEQNATAELQNNQAEEMNKYYVKVADFLKQYAKEKGYKMILTYSKNNPNMLYGDPSLDITSDVIKRLNDAYAKEGAK